jgi:hypothetical protein
MGEFDLGKNQPNIRALEAVYRPREAIIRDLIPCFLNNPCRRQRVQSAPRARKLQRIFKFKPAKATPRSLKGQKRHASITLLRKNADANTQIIDATEVTLDDMGWFRPGTINRGTWVTDQKASLDLDSHSFALLRPAKHPP